MLNYTISTIASAQTKCPIQMRKCKTSTPEQIFREWRLSCNISNFFGTMTK